MQLPEICALWGPYLSPWSHPMWWLILLHISRNCDQWPTCTSYSLNTRVSVPFLDSRVADPVGVGSGTIRMRKKTFRIRPKSDRIRIWNPATRIHWLQKRLNRLFLTVYSSVNSLSLAYRSFLPRTLQHNGWKNGNLYYKLFERNFIFNLLICF